MYQGPAAFAVHTDDAIDPSYFTPGKTALQHTLSLMRDQDDSFTLVLDAIKFLEESETISSDVPHLDHYLSLGSIKLSECYDCTDDYQLLLEAIKLGRKALSLRPPGHPFRANSCRALAISLKTGYDSTDNDQLLMEAIDCWRESLSLHAPGHSGRVYSCAALVDSLRTLYNITSDDQLLSEAIDIERELLSLYPPGHHHRALCCNNLAKSLGKRYESTGDDQLLIELIGLEREILTLYPLGHANHAWSCNNLIISLMRRYESTGDDLLLIEAIELERKSLSLCPPGHADRAPLCANLAISLRTRYNSTGDDPLLIEAIDLGREMLSLQPSENAIYASSCVNLALSLKNRYNSIGNDLLLIEAIELERKSLSLCPPGHPNRAIPCTNLAASLRMRYKNTGDDSIIMEVIDFAKESLSLHPPGHPYRATSCENLANSLLMLYSCTGDDRLLIDVHDICQEGLANSKHHNTVWRCASVLVWLYSQPGSELFNASTAIHYLSLSLQHHPDDVSQAVASVVYCFDDIWRIARDLHVNHFTDMKVIYQHFIRLLPFLSNPLLDTPAQLRALRSCSRIGSAAFVNAALAEDYSTGLEELEVVQGLLWSQRLNYRDPQLSHIPPDLAGELQLHLKALAAPPVDSITTAFASIALTSRDIQHNHVTRVYALLREIRKHPGLERFMLGESRGQLFSVARAHPVVVLVGTREWFYALVLSSSETCDPKLLRLDWSQKDFDDIPSIQSTARVHRGTGMDNGVMDDVQDRGIKRPKSTLQTPFSRRMRYLWFKVVKPVLEQLGIQPRIGHIRPRLHWCPTGVFSALPFHAAGVHDGPLESQFSCSEYVVSSYTPTLTTLLRVQKAVLPLSKASSRMTLVAEKRAQEQYLDTIRQVDVELDNVATVAKANCVDITYQSSTSTTVSATCDAMETATMVHLACHGIQDDADATRSGFCLGDGRLTISKIMELSLDNASLAFLSACETAKGDQSQPDQVMHLAAAMLFAGFTSVIATMWYIVPVFLEGRELTSPRAISDVDGPKVAKWFYEELFAHEVIDADRVAYALDVAVGKLRAQGVALDRWAPFIHMGA